MYIYIHVCLLLQWVLIRRLLFSICRQVAKANLITAERSAVSRKKLIMTNKSWRCRAMRKEIRRCCSWVGSWGPWKDLFCSKQGNNWKDLWEKVLSEDTGRPKNAYEKKKQQHLFKDTGSVKGKRLKAFWVTINTQKRHSSEKQWNVWRMPLNLNTSVPCVVLPKEHLEHLWNRGLSKGRNVQQKNKNNQEKKKKPCGSHVC